MENNLVNYEQPKSFAFLGENEALCIYDPASGYLKGNDLKIKLRMSMNHFYGIKQTTFERGQRITSYTYKLTAEGYDYINRFLGLKVVAPAKFTMNGVEYSNPTIEYDELGNKGKVMYVCAIAGRDPSGKVHITPPVMTSFSQEESMITTLTNKIRSYEEYEKNKDKVKPVGFLCPLRSKDKKLAESDFYEYFPITKSRGIIVDVSHIEFIKAEANMAAKRENIERTIVTVTKRNAMRRHPAVGTYTLHPAQVKDAQTGELDMVAYVHAKQWTLGIDEELEAAVQNHKDFENPEAQDYDEVSGIDGEDGESGEIIIDDETIVTTASEIVSEDMEENIEEDIEAEEAKEIAELKAWIKKNWKAVGGSKAMKDFNVGDDSTIMELKSAKDYMERRLMEIDAAKGDNK